MNRVLLSVLNFVGSVLVAVFIDLVRPDALSTKEQWFVGGAIFIALMSAETLFATGTLQSQVDALKTSLAQATEVRQAENHAVAVRSELDASVSEIHRLLGELSGVGTARTDLFFEYFKRRLHALQSGLNDACVKQQAQIDETMFSVTDWLYGSSFHGKDSDIFRAVLPSGDVDFFFDVHTRMYFMKMYQLVKSGQAKGVKRLLIVDNPDHLADERLIRLLTFHSFVDGYECRTIMRQDFTKIVNDYRLQHLVVDFGIYGTTYLYKGLTNSIEEIVGMYSRDRDEIALFIECFESAWQVGTVPPVAPGIDRSDVSVEWVFGSTLPLAATATTASAPAQAGARPSLTTTGAAGGGVQ